MFLSRLLIEYRPKMMKSDIGHVKPFHFSLKESFVCTSGK